MGAAEDAAAGAAQRAAEGAAGGSGVAHVLREHELVVGARVVVRHRLADGSASDALGELTAADGELLVVATRRGPVRVRRADVLAGKAVPPPPRRRGAPHEAVGVEELELVAAEHWRPDEREDLGGWRLRAAGGFTGRANSALAVASPGVPLPQALAAVEAFYARRGLPARVAVPHAAGADPQGVPVARELARRGWAVLTPTLVLTAAVRALAGAGAVPLPPGCSVLRAAEPDEGWLEGWLEGWRDPGGAALPAAARRVLLSADAQVFVRVLDGGATVAVARGSASPGWVGVSAVRVAPSHRRRGLARRLLAEVADWGRARGATSAHLQVAEASGGARALYEGAGFGVHHAYHYRVRPAP
ncbi:GNAT family N-acetyltransferase [Kineococcus sp. SYSU DK005]|uniref:GNAT family N-acetyltransferase n=1 Tax=Kineococcus sp. SYSU DK005 TaxID=3383126 RepID=UPI003D7D941A